MAGHGGSVKLDLGVLSAEQQDKLRQYKVRNIRPTTKLKSYVSLPRRLAQFISSTCI